MWNHKSLKSTTFLVNESWNEDLEPDLHLEENISNLDISGILDFTPTNSLRKNVKERSSYCTIEEVKDIQNVKSNYDAENKKSIIEKELDTIQKLVNSLKRSSENEK